MQSISVLFSVALVVVSTAVGSSKEIGKALPEIGKALPEIGKALPEIGKAQTIRYLIAYTGRDSSGPSKSFFVYSPDLSLDGIDNNIASACSTGLWIFYGDANYEGLTCPTFGISTCSDLSSECVDEVSSLRYAGDPDKLDGDYFNLYAGESFTGAEFRSNVTSISVGDLDLEVSSLIVSGSSGWTFFTGLEFSGTAVCVTPDQSLSHEDGTVINYGQVTTLVDIDLPDNSIRSAIKGCGLVRGVGSSPHAVPHRFLGQVAEENLDN